MKAFDAAATGTFTPSILTLKDSEGVDVGGFANFEYWNMAGEDPADMTSYEITETGTDATATGLVQGPGVILIDWTKGEEQYDMTTGEPNPSWAPDIISRNEHTLEGSIRQVAPLNLDFKYTTLVPGFHKKILMEAAAQATGVQGVPSPLNTFTISHSDSSVLSTGLPWDTALFFIHGNFSVLTETAISKLLATPEEFPNWKIRRDYSTDKETINGYDPNESYESYTTFSGLPEGNNVDAQLIRPDEGITINTITQDTWINQNVDEAIIRFSNFPIRLQPDDGTEAYDPITVEQQTWKPVPISYDYYIFEPILYRIDYLLENNWSRWKGKITDPGTGYSINDLRIFTDIHYDTSVIPTGNLVDDHATREKLMLNITSETPSKTMILADSWDNGMKGFLSLASTDGYIIINSQCDGIVDAGTGNNNGAVITNQLLDPNKQVYAEWSEYPPAKDYTQGGWVVEEIESFDIAHPTIPIFNYRWYVVKESRDSTGLRNIKEGGLFDSNTEAMTAAQRYIQRMQN
jgi:hypothetical protein